MRFHFQKNVYLTQKIDFELGDIKSEVSPNLSEHFQMEAIKIEPKDEPADEIDQLAHDYQQETTKSVKDEEKINNRVSFGIIENQSDFEDEKKEKYNFCHECGQLFPTKDSLVTHLLTHEIKRPEECSVCKEKFENRMAQIVHSHQHSKGKRPYPCDKCDKSFFTAFAQSAHAKNVHQEPPKDQFNCNICSKIFETRNALVSHVKSTHKCDRCGKIFSTKSLLIRHRCSMAEKSKKGVSDTYTCEVCAYVFLHEATLKKHKEIHRVGKKRPKIYGRNMMANFHLDKQTPEVLEKLKPYQCGNCGKRFFRHLQVESHKCHSEDEEMLERRVKLRREPTNKLNLYKTPLYECHKCGKIFSDRFAFGHHVATHNGPKIHQCIVCGNCYSNESTLKMHRELAHSDSKTNYSNFSRCKVCSKFFTKRGHLIYHIKTVHKKCSSVVE